MHGLRQMENVVDMKLQDTTLFDLKGPLVSRARTEKSGLEEWFERMHTLRFSRFTDADLARACRQKVFPEYIVPYALTVLGERPLAGALYDGELFASLIDIPADFWQQNAPCRNELIELFSRCREFLANSIDEQGMDEYDFAKLQIFVATIEESAT